MDKRKEGYYWVIPANTAWTNTYTGGGDPEVAFWSCLHGGEWIISGTDFGDPYLDSDFEVISGPIEAPPSPIKKEKLDNKIYVDKVNANEYPQDINIPLDKPFIDDRGIIQNLWLGNSGSITRIESKKGAVRAKHKHTDDWHATYVLKGKIEYTEGEPGGPQCSTVFEAGDMFFTRPGIYHIMKFIEDSDMITVNGIVKNHENYEKDIKRY